MSRTAPWMVGQRERERERERDERKRRVYVVVHHSSGTGGYVVRTGEKRADGSIYVPSPYTDAKPVAVSNSQKLAQRKADKLNGFA